MPENILIAIAWPYANAEIHVGNITGSHLPGDIVARYHRLKGNNVLVVSGTDSHGIIRIPRYIDLYEQGKIDLDGMVTKEYGLEDINTAFQNILAENKVARAEALGMLSEAIAGQNPRSS